MEASPACDGGKEHQGVAVDQTGFRAGHAPVHEQDQLRLFLGRYGQEPQNTADSLAIGQRQAPPVRKSAGERIFNAERLFLVRASFSRKDDTLPERILKEPLLGGVVMVLGPVVGAFLLVAIQDYFAQVGAWVTNIQGIIFVACGMTLRRGIVGKLREWWQRRNR
jgi:hypothetical protein